MSVFCVGIRLFENKMAKNNIVSIPKNGIRRHFAREVRVGEDKTEIKYFICYEAKEVCDASGREKIVTKEIETSTSPYNPWPSVSSIRNMPDDLFERITGLKIDR